VGYDRPIMSNLSWQIGNVRVTRVEESCSTFPYIGLFPNVSEEDWRGHLDWLQPGFADAEGNLVLSVHGLVVESQGRTILVDTCMGPHQVEGIPSPEHSPFLENLEAAGFPLDSIDVVLCTHMHFDHVGWNTREVDGRWVPTFPRARYLFARVEWEHWSREKELGFAATLNESVRPLIDADQADLVESDHKLTDEVWLEATPGHTPGHVAVRMASDGAAAMITGDLTHHPVQWAEPQWGMLADSDSAQAVATRRRLIDAHADGGLLVIGTHYAPPTAGEIVSHEGGWRFRAR